MSKTKMRLRRGFKWLIFPLRLDALISFYYSERNWYTDLYLMGRSDPDVRPDDIAAWEQKAERQTRHLSRLTLMRR